MLEFSNQTKMTDVCGNNSNSIVSDDSLFELIVVQKSSEKSVIKANKKARKLKMNFEKYRLESFINWPLTYISPIAMANNGFFYLGLGDRVQCNFCNVELCDWTAEDIPTVEHQKHAPYCNFVSKCNAKTDNISLARSIYESGMITSNVSIPTRGRISCLCRGDCPNNESIRNYESNVKFGSNVGTLAPPVFEFNNNKESLTQIDSAKDINKN